MPTQTFELEVPSGVNDMSLALTVPENGYTIAGYLVDPNGMALDSASTIDANGAAVNTVQLFRANPQAGLWRFVLNELTSAGTQTSIVATGKVELQQRLGRRRAAPLERAHAALRQRGAGLDPAHRDQHRRGGEGLLR